MLGPEDDVDVGLVIFDCDGVLVDSERLAVRVEAELLAALGWPLSEADTAVIGSWPSATRANGVGLSVGRKGRAGRRSSPAPPAEQRVS